MTKVEKRNLQKGYQPKNEILKKGYQPQNAQSSSNYKPPKGGSAVRVPMQNVKK